MTNGNLKLSDKNMKFALKLLKEASSIVYEQNEDSENSYNSNEDDNISGIEDVLKTVNPDNEKFSPAIAYEIWNNDKTDENFKNVFNALKPTIKYALASNNALNDPLIETKAKVLTAKAIKSFDPTYGTSLPTYLNRQLQKLSRFTRDMRSPIKIPERQLYAAAELAKVENELKDKYGRDPTVSDIADEMGIPIKKVENIRKQFVKQISEKNYFSGVTEEDDTSSNDEQGAYTTDFTKEAISYVYNDLGYRDKKILEYSTGFGGSDILTPKEIAKKLKLSLSQISRINAKLANRIFDVKKSLERVYN